jgi:hypothetical protein
MGGDRVSSEYDYKVDPPPDVRVARLAAEQHGVVSHAQLLGCGLSRTAVFDRIRGGRLHRLHRGVYAVGHQAVTMEGGFLAAVLTCGQRAFLSHYAAGALWGFLPWDERQPEVTVIATSAPTRPGLHIHRTRAIHPDDVTRRHGIRVTTPARALLDLAEQLPHRAERRAVRQAQADRRVNVRQIHDVLTRANGRRGAAALAAIVASGPAPTRSELEDLVLDLLDNGGIERPEVNAPVQLDGRCVVPDFLWRAQRLVLEADSARWHAGAIAREDDAERQALLEAHGFRVIRTTWDQALRRPRQTLTRILNAGAPRAQRQQSSP